MVQHWKINVSHLINRLRKNYLILSTDTEKNHLAKSNTHSCLKKRKSQQTRNKEELPQLDEDYLQKAYS